jgi:hypothetical protein
MHFDNDNIVAPVSGKAARAWPALARAIKEGDIDSVKTLRLFECLYEIANTDPDAIASPAGRFKEDGDLELAGLTDEAHHDEDGESEHNGYQTDYTNEYGPTPEALVEMTRAGCYSMITRNFKTAGVANDKFRIRRIYQNQKVDGEVTRTFYSWAEYKGSDGRWYRAVETLKRPRGPDRDDDDSLTWTHTAHPSGKTGWRRFELPAEERLNARQELDQLRDDVGDEAFEIWRTAAVEKSTRKAIGESRGKTYGRASALGSELLKQAGDAVNRNWKYAETA